MENLDSTRLPKHIAIIMDGNGRWAQEKGQDRLYGHFHGVESVRNIVEAAAEIGIKYLTLYAFSTENWDRPAPEVAGLMSLFVDTISKEVPSLHKNNIKLHFIGNLALLPDDAKKALETATATTAQNTGLELIIALSYSSRWELIEAIQKLAQQVQEGTLLPQDIKEASLSAALATSAFPDPELMIRTSGEYRISNFLLYQLAYAELYFTETRWPDFRKKDLIEAILDFQSRERRFGKTGQQVQTNDENK
jgi:undecaprenyl diphosphate synthase